MCEPSKAPAAVPPTGGAGRAAPTGRGDVIRTGHRAYATKVEQGGEAPADARRRATQELRLLRATRRTGGSALRGAVLPDQPARPGMGDSEALPQHAHGAPATLRAHQISRFNSLSMSMS